MVYIGNPAENLWYARVHLYCVCLLTTIKSYAMNIRKQSLAVFQIFFFALLIAARLLDTTAMFTLLTVILLLLVTLLLVQYKKHGRIRRIAQGEVDFKSAYFVLLGLMLISIVLYGQGVLSHA